LRALICFN